MTRSFNRRRYLITALAAATATLAVLVGNAAAAPPALGPPGSSEDNPITAVGGAWSSPVYVDIKWGDGTTEQAVTGASAVSSDLAASVLAARGAAENRDDHGFVRSPTGRTTQSSHRRHVSDNYGSTACSVSMSIYKYSSTEAAGDTAVSCTTDVYNINGTEYLYRSANFTIIGSQAKNSNVSYVTWHATGGCLSSTWQYWSSISYVASSSVNGSAGFYHQDGPVWITC